MPTVTARERGTKTRRTKAVSTCEEIELYYVECEYEQ